MSSMHGERMRLQILDAGLAIWRKSGPAAVTARAVGKAVGLTHAGVLHHCRSSSGLRDAVAQWAVQTRDRTVVPQLITSGHPAAASLSPALRAEYLGNVL